MQHCFSLDTHKDLLAWFAAAPSETRLEVMRRLNPACVIEFTATPVESNVLYRVFPSRLKAEEMVKLPFNVAEHPSWEEAVLRAVETRKTLAGLAAKDAHELRLETITALRRKKAPLRRKLELHAGTLQKLADEGCSLRQMAAYARKHLKFTVSPAYLRQFCIEFGITFRRKA